MSTDGNGNGDMSFQNAFLDAAGEPPITPETTPAQQPAAPQPIEPIPAPDPTPQPQPTPEPQPPAAETPTPAFPTPADSQAPPQSIIAQRAAEAGLDITGKNDAQIFDELANGYKTMQPYAQWGQQLAPHYDEIQEFFKQQQSQQATPEPAQQQEPEWSPEQYFQEQWKAPQWDPQFDVAINNNMVQRNAETGLWQSAPGFEQMTMGIVPKMNETLTNSEQQWRDLTRSNPYEKFHGVLLEPMRREWQSDIDRIISERIAAIQEEQQVNTFEQDNASWLYQKDPNSGQYTFTPEGAKFAEVVDSLRAFNPNATRQQLLEEAIRINGIPNKQTPQTQQLQTTAPTQPQQQPPQAPQQTAPAPSPQESFLQQAIQRAAHAPNAGGFTQQNPESHPVNVGENELNNMFNSAAALAKLQ